MEDSYVHLDERWSIWARWWWRREWKDRVIEAEVYNLDLDVLVRRDRSSRCVDV